MFWVGYFPSGWFFGLIFKSSLTISVLSIAWNKHFKPLSEFLTHLVQCHISIAPENVRKPLVTFSGGIEM